MTPDEIQSKINRVNRAAEFATVARDANTDHAFLLCAADDAKCGYEGLELAGVAFIAELARPCGPLIESAGLLCRGGARFLAWIADRAAVGTTLLTNATDALRATHDVQGHPTTSEVNAAMSAAYAEAAPLRPDVTAATVERIVPHVGETWGRYFDRCAGNVPDGYQSHVPLSDAMRSEWTWDALADSWRNPRAV